MRKFVQIVLAAVLGLSLLSGTAQKNDPAKAEPPRFSAPKAEAPRPEQTAQKSLLCNPNWTGKNYKPFDKVQDEVRAHYGDVRILRVALCGEGPAAYFQIVVISHEGSVSSIRLAASN